MTIALMVFGPIATIAALGVVIARKAVHSALFLAVVMISLAGIYASLEAPFLFAVQIIVYTGAILMLFLFVLMLIGVETKEAITEEIKGQRTMAFLAAALFAVIGILVIAQTSTSVVVGLDEANAAGNVEGLAALLFGKYVLAVEFTAALLMTAALGAMVLSHRERFAAKVGQKQVVLNRMAEYAKDGTHPGNPPTPGVYARSNAVDVPALLPDGSYAENSVHETLRRRGQIVEGFEDHAAKFRAQIEEGEE